MCLPPLQPGEPVPASHKRAERIGFIIFVIVPPVGIFLSVFLARLFP